MADDHYWDETTSFYLLTSEGGAESVRDGIMASSKINKDDVLVVINISVTKGHAARGIQDTARFKALMDRR